MIKIRHWGVRGSVASPLTAKQSFGKIASLLMEFAKSGRSDYKQFLAEKPFWQCATYGGNTSCVELQCGLKELDTRIVLDIGTGARGLGDSLFQEMFTKGGLNITFLLSHVHWDHIQGLPFFGPLYINKALGIRNSWTFYGGTDWMKHVEPCLKLQMDSPNFPVSWGEIKKITHQMEGHSLVDRKSFDIGPAKVETRKLFHPQETYGWRIKCDGKVVVYTTDNEPYNPLFPDKNLLDLAKEADVWITDCQYTQETYEGVGGGTPRHGWGHSYPEAIVETVLQAGVKQVILFHHDPGSSDEDIYKMEQKAKELIAAKSGTAKVTAAWEGLEINL